MTPEVQLWTGMTAAQARANGAIIPSSVPDCATLSLMPDAGSVETVDNGERLPTIKFTVRMQWSWVTVTGTVDLTVDG